MPKRLLLVDNGINAHYRPAEDWAEHLSLPTDTIRAPFEPFPNTLVPYSHLLFTGGLSSTCENALWQQQERALILRAINENKNVLCVCFGFQLLAQAVFGPEAVCSRLTQGKAPEIGWTEISVRRDDRLLGEQGRSHWAYVIHFDDVCRVDTEIADIIAVSDACPIHGVKLKGQNVWGVQAHFEVNMETGSRYNAMYTAAYPQISGVIMKPARDSGFIVPMMSCFEQL